MRITSMVGGLLTRTRKAEDVVRIDADALLEIWGETAYAVAGNLSWREDSGLMRSSNPGHWARVQRDIGRRMRIADEPVFDQPAMAA